MNRYCNFIFLKRVSTVHSKRRNKVQMKKLSNGTGERLENGLALMLRKLIENIASYINDTSVERVLFKWGKGRKVARPKTAYGFAEVYLGKKHVY